MYVISRQVTAATTTGCLRRTNESRSMRKKRREFCFALEHANTYVYDYQVSDDYADSCADHWVVLCKQLSFSRIYMISQTQDYVQQHMTSFVEGSN